MECKVSSVRLKTLFIIIGIYPEWNVKILLLCFSHSSRLDWNISRMECKAPQAVSAPTCIYIGIYPEWNVKIVATAVCAIVFIIGIYPEWNVKLNHFRSYPHQ